MEYSIDKINEIIKGKLIKNNNLPVKYILIDSRTLTSPENSIFFALKGDRNDGHNYINDLYDRNVRNFIISNETIDLSAFNEANFIIVDDTLKALHKFTAFHRKQFDIPIIGITGSNGKTIIKEWIYEILNTTKNIVRNPKSYNSQIGVPLSVWLINKDNDLGIFEAGISKFGEMTNLQKIINPTIGVFSNIGEAHQENFIDFKQKISEKLKLFYNSKVLIYSKDHSLIDSQIQEDVNLEDCELFTWSTKFPANVSIGKIQKQTNKTIIPANYDNKKIEIEIPFTDDASIENSINVLVVLLYLKIDKDVIINGFKNLNPIAMRLELKTGEKNCIIINDSYNSDINSLNIALDFLNQQKQNKTKTLILSDILQTGKDIKILYKEINKLLEQKQIDKLIGIGTEIKSQAKIFKIESYFFNNTDNFLNNLPNFENEIILLKGARNFEFERISNILQQKFHDTVLEINLNSIIKNLNYYKSLLKPKTKLMVMVKAFSYGSGMYEIANLLQYHKVDYLTVAFADEGIQLRKSGITLPIMVMNPEQNTFDSIIKFRLEPEIYNFTVLEKFYDAVRRNGLVIYPIHLKIDTGMKRLGFEESEIDDLINNIKTKPEFNIKSILSHLVGSDEEIHDKFSELQISRFLKISEKISNNYNYKIYKHILNSSGIERFANAQFDMVRLGIGLYGFSPNNQDKLEPVNSLKTVISQIKTVKVGETVGYGRKGKVTRDSKIAILPIGYADGLNRRLSNGVGKFFINNNKVPVIGNICMDMCMIDITDIDNVKEGDIVEIFGKNNPINQIAKSIDTIPYEILTGISQRVKRIFYHE